MPQPQVDWRYDNNLMGAMRDDPLYNLNGLNDPSAQYDALTRAGWTHDDIMDVYGGTAIGTIGRLMQQYNTPPLDQRGQVGGYRYQFPASQRRVANATGTQVGNAVGAAAAGGNTAARQQTPAGGNTASQQQQQTPAGGNTASQQQLATPTVNQQPQQSTQPQQPAQGNTVSAGGVTITSPLLGAQPAAQQPVQQPQQPAQQTVNPIDQQGLLGAMARTQQLFDLGQLFAPYVYDEIPPVFPANPVAGQLIDPVAEQLEALQRQQEADRRARLADYGYIGF